MQTAPDGRYIVYFDGMSSREFMVEQLSKANSIPWLIASGIFILLFIVILIILCMSLYRKYAYGDNIDPEDRVFFVIAALAVVALLGLSINQYSKWTQIPEYMVYQKYQLTLE